MAKCGVYAVLVLVSVFCASASAIPSRVATKQEISALVKKLASKDRNVKTAAMQELDVIGKLAVPVLIEILGDNPDPITHTNTLLSLGRLWPAAKDAMPFAVAGLTHDNARVRVAAAYVIGGMGEDARYMLPQLLDIAGRRSASEDFRRIAVISISRIDPDCKESVPVFVTCLTASGVRLRAAAAEALGESDDAIRKPEVLRALAGALKDKNKDVRNAAVYSVSSAIGKSESPAMLVAMNTVLESDDEKVAEVVLSKFWYDDRPDLCRLFIPSLIRYAENATKPGRFRKMAIEVVVGVSPRDPRVITAITGLLKSESVDVRVFTCEAARFSYVQTSNDVVALLKKHMKMDEPNVRLAAAKTLWSARFDPVAISVIAELLHHSDKSVRTAALEELKDSHMCRAVRPMVPSLLRLLKDKNPTMRVEAASLLWKMCRMPRQVLPTLTDILDNCSEEDSLVAAMGLVEKMGPAARVTTGRLAEIVAGTRESPERVRAAAARAMATIGKPTPEVLLALKKAMRHESPFVQAEAARALWRVTGDAKAVIPVLLKVLASGDRADKTVFGVLTEMGPDAAAAVPVLVKMLDGERFGGDSRILPAAKTLGSIGPQASAAVKGLTQLLKSAKGQDRWDVALALWQVTRDAERCGPILLCTLDADREWKLPKIWAAVGYHNRAHVLKLLMDKLDTADSNAKLRATEILDLLECDNDIFTRVILECAKDKRSRLKAFEEFVGRDSLTPAAVASLVHAIGDPNSRVRQVAAQALVNNGIRDKIVSDALMRTLDDHSKFVGVFALGISDRDGRPRRCIYEFAEPFLLKAFRRDDDGFILPVVARACRVTGIGSDLLEVEMRKGMKTELIWSRVSCARALWTTRGDLASTLPLLSAVIEKDCGSARREAVDGICDMAAADTPQAKRLAGMLNGLLSDYDYQVRATAARGLGKARHVDKKAIEALKVCLSDADDGVRQGAAFSLWKITGRADIAVAPLVTDMKHPDKDVRKAAAETLGKIGPAAKAAAGALAIAMKDRDHKVRCAAAEALWLIKCNRDAAMKLLKAEQASYEWSRIEQAKQTLKRIETAKRATTQPADCK